MMLKPVGLIGFFEGRIFSGHGMPRSKPHPDVYLAAAAHLQIDPAGCPVIEGTKEGITAGVAAGATVWAYAAPPAEHAPLVQVGAARACSRACTSCLWVDDVARAARQRPKNSLKPTDSCTDRQSI
jgi:beta-phosphoglucomutase-like phosphatase (HAD superfamily)